MGLFRLIVICMIFLVSSSITFSQPLGEEYEPTPEELDAAFTSSGYEAIKTGYSDNVYPNVVEITPTTLLATADLVIEGVVTEIRYTYEDNGLPTAHTELAMTRVLKGQYTKPTLIITQPGGPERDGRHVSLVSSSQFFNVGDTEFLFLDIPSPESVYILHRFRVHEDRIHTVDGYGVLMDANGALRFSADRNPAERFEIINLGTHQLRKNFSEPEPRLQEPDLPDPDAPITSSEASYTQSIRVDDFIAALTQE